MLLYRKRSWIEFKSKKVPTWKICGGRASYWVCDELGDNSGDLDGGITKEEELVDAWYNERPRKTKNPGAKSRNRHERVIRVRDRAAHLSRNE